MPAKCGAPKSTRFCLSLSASMFRKAPAFPSRCQQTQVQGRLRLRNHTKGIMIMIGQWASNGHSAPAVGPHSQLIVPMYY